MKKLNKLGKISVTCSMILISACAGNTKKPEESAERKQEIQACKNKLMASNKIQRDSVVLGCLGPSIIGKITGNKTYTCIVGSGAGFLLGGSVAERKCEYIDLASQLDGEIAHTSKLNSNLGSLLVKQNSQLRLQQSKAETLTAKNQKAASDKTALENLQKDLTNQLEKTRYALAQLQEEQQFKQETADKAKAAHLEQAKTKKLASEIKALQQNIKKLRANDQTLANINTSILRH